MATAASMQVMTQCAALSSPHDYVGMWTSMLGAKRRKVGTKTTTEALEHNESVGQWHYSFDDICQSRPSDRYY